MKTNISTARLASSSKARGFTLIELLMVMAIIAVLATLTVGAFRYAQQAAARNRTSGALAAIKASLEQYKEKFGEYPEPSGSGGSVNGVDGSSAAMLYQAITGDGTDAIKLAGTGEQSDGENSEEEMKNAINPNLPPAMIYPPRSQPGGKAGTPGFRYLMDGFGRPFQYQKAPTAAGGGTATTINPTYDLWSFGNIEGDIPTPSSITVQYKSDPTNTGTWIKNW